MKQEAARVFELLEEAGYSDMEFCKTRYFPYSTLNDWRNGRRTPSTDLITEFCKKLGITKAKFYAGIDNKKADENESASEIENVREYAYYSNKVIELGIEDEVLPVMEAVVAKHEAS